MIRRKPKQGGGNPSDGHYSPSNNDAGSVRSREEGEKRVPVLRTLMTRRNVCLLLTAFITGLPLVLNNNNRGHNNNNFLMGSPSSAKLSNPPRVVWLDEVRTSETNHRDISKEYEVLLSNRRDTGGVLNRRQRTLIRRELRYPMVTTDYLDSLIGAKTKGYADPLEAGECKALDWQKTSLLSCNRMHEIDMVRPIADKNMKHPDVTMIANGGWRDVWALPEPLNFTDTTSKEVLTPRYFVLKTILWEHDYTERNFERHRRDAISMERLTKSPHVSSIFAFCGHSGVFEYADGGSLWDTIAPDGYDKPAADRNNVTKIEKLRLAVQTTKGLADFHGIDGEGHPTISHTDITTDQYVNIKGVIKLNDFNRARFITYKEVGNNYAKCPFRVGHNPGSNRSPEEYEGGDETEKIDVYSMGNCIYTILTNLDVFESISSKAAIAKVKRGERPPIDAKLQASTHPVDVVLRNVIDATMKQKPQQRIGARQAQTMLEEVLNKLDPEWKNTDPYNKKTKANP